jgi:hypothetical protein
MGLRFTENITQVNMYERVAYKKQPFFNDVKFRSFHKEVNDVK